MNFQMYINDTNLWDLPDNLMLLLNFPQYDLELSKWILAEDSSTIQLPFLFFMQQHIPHIDPSFLISTFFQNTFSNFLSHSWPSLKFTTVSSSLVHDTWNRESYPSLPLNQGGSNIPKLPLNLGRSTFIQAPSQLRGLNLFSTISENLSWLLSFLSKLS